MWGEVVGGATRELSSGSQMREFNSDDEYQSDSCYLFQIKYLIHFLTVVSYYMCNNQDD